MAVMRGSCIPCSDPGPPLAPANTSVDAGSTGLNLHSAGGTPASIWARFFGYLTADGLNYLLGFVIYGWLIRTLTDRQYGYLSIGTSIYQVLMMVTALGL